MFLWYGYSLVLYAKASISVSSPCCAHNTFDGAGVTPTHKLIPGIQPEVVVLGLLDVVVVAVVVGQFGPGWQVKHPASFHS